jgi:alpha-galactosidase
VPEGRTEILCDRGQCYRAPFALVRNEGTGEYAICSLAWSANWHLWLEHGTGDPFRLRFGMGPWAGDALRVMAPGETVRTPAVHLGMIAGDLDHAVQALHRHVRRSVLPARAADRAHLVQFSLPGDQGYLSTRFGDASGYTEESVLAAVELAAALGAELFIMDAGWWEVQGDWSVSRVRFPRGLDPIVDRVHEKGMLFGLYAEIEKAAAHSRVGREHPDWIEWHSPYPVLDLARPEVEAYLEHELISLIERYRLDLFRLDFNTPTDARFEGLSSEHHGVAENNFWRYYEAFHRVFARVRTRFPDLILQQAACGGGRNDLAMAAGFHEHYLTDGLRLPYELQNYTGQTLLLPPEVLVIGRWSGAGHG